MPLTHTQVAPKFSSVAKVFEDYAGADAQAQLSVYVDGEQVIDVASNIDPDAMMTVYSVSKGLSALALAKLVDLHKLDLDQTVAHYWPEFGQSEKQNVTVRQMLSHQAGLPETDIPLTPEDLLDDHAAANRLAAQLPVWFPGKAHGYHGISIGPLMSELVFRITGQSIQQFYEAEIRAIAQADAYLGLPEELESRVVDLLPGLPPTNAQLEKYGPLKNWRNPSPLNHHVFGGGLETEALIGPRARRFGLASAAGVASARGLAKVMQYALDNISAEVFDRFAQMQAYGLDIVLDQPARGYGVVFMKPTPTIPFGSHRAFGHDGAGGAMVLHDPVGKITLGYTLRQVEYPGGMDPRLQMVIDALNDAVTN